MANLKNVVEVSRDNYNTLSNDGTVGDYTFSNNDIYLITVNKNGEVWPWRDVVNVDVNNNTSGVFTVLDVSGGEWFVEGWSDLTCGTVNFGIIDLNTDATSSNPLVILGANTTSTTLTTNINVRLTMYKAFDSASETDRWKVVVATGNSSYNSFSNVATYNLTFRRVYI